MTPETLKNLSQKIEIFAAALEKINPEKPVKEQGVEICDAAIELCNVKKEFEKLHEKA